MTVETTTNLKRVQGDGSTTAISITFRVLDESDLKVYLVNRTTGAATLQTGGGTHYSVSLDDDGEGGTVTMVTAPSSSYDVLILNRPETTQTADLPSEGNFNEESVETALDRLCLIAINFQEQLGRCLKLTTEDSLNVTGYAGLFMPTDLAATRANKLIGWNDDGTEITHYTGADVDLTLVSAFAETLFDDTSASEARTTLGLGTAAVENIAGIVTAPLPNADNSLDLGSSSKRWQDIYLSGGVYLGGTGAANLMDDYEEGSWTPAFTSTSATFAYTYQIGTYVKCGRMVTLNFRLKLSGAPGGTTSNGTFISGLPFAVKNVTDLFLGGDIGAYFNINLVSGTHLSYSVGATGVTVELKESGDNLIETGLVASALTGSSTEIRGSITYISA